MQEIVDTALCKDLGKANAKVLPSFSNIQTSLEQVKNVYLEEEVKNCITYLKTAKHNKASCPNIT